MDVKTWPLLHLETYVCFRFMITFVLCFTMGKAHSQCVDIPKMWSQTFLSYTPYFENVPTCNFDFFVRWYLVSMRGKKESSFHTCSILYATTNDWVDKLIPNLQMKCCIPYMIHGVYTWGGYTQQLYSILMHMRIMRRCSFQFMI